VLRSIHCLAWVLRPDRSYCWILARDFSNVPAWQQGGL